ncbi:MAG: hypothetical protein LC650_05265, partial [Actinobacteria bacterium]|nr:hypothetical protein [Actinomycetota bacterium]
GAYTVAASASGVGSVTFNATANAAAANSFAFDQVNSPQTAGQPFGIRIVALDSEGNIATGYQGTVGLEAANGSISPGEANFTNGTVSLDVSLTTAAAGQSITATDGSISGTSNTFDVQSGGVSASNSSVSAIPSSLSAGLSSTLTIELSDGSNNPVTVPAGDISIAVSGDATSGSLSGSGNTYTADITNQTAETVTATVSVNGITLNDTPSIEFTPAGADEFTVVSGNNQSGSVTEQLSSDFVVRVADAFDNSVQGVEVEFNIVSVPGSASGQNLSNTAVQTNVSGEASTRLTLGDAPGTYRVEASVSGVGTVTFMADAETGAATQMEIVTQPENTRAGQAISPSPQVRVTDSAGNGVGGVSITVREDGGYNFDAGTLTQVTSASGVVVFDDLVIESSGRYTLVFDASASGVSSVSSNAINVNPGQGNADNTTATVPDGTAGETTEITIEVEDEFSNPVGGAAEELSVEISGANVATPTVSETAVTGTYTASYTPTAAGTDFFLIEIRGIEISGSPYTSSVSTSGISGSESSVVASAASVQVGSSATVTVQVRDDAGNEISGLSNSDFTISASGDAVAGQVNETSNSGAYVFTVRNETAQTVTVTATVSGVTLDDTPQIEFTPGDANIMAFSTQPGDAVA